MIPSGVIEVKSQGAAILLLPKSVQDFLACQDFLTEDGMAFHTFPLPEEKEVKIMMAEIPHVTPILWAWEDLTEKVFVPTTVTPLLSGDRKREMNFVLSGRWGTILLSTL